MHTFKDTIMVTFNHCRTSIIADDYTKPVKITGFSEDLEKTDLTTDQEKEENGDYDIPKTTI